MKWYTIAAILILAPAAAAQQPVNPVAPPVVRPPTTPGSTAPGVVLPGVTPPGAVLPGVQPGGTPGVPPLAGGAGVFPGSPLGGGAFPGTPPADAPLPPIPPARPMFRGPEGVFLFDSGNYLLGGVQGLSRSTGAFTMGTPPPRPGEAYYHPGYGTPSPNASCPCSRW